MSFGRLGDTNEPMSEMNVIPLVDVMLVLLVIFIVTAPVITHSVQLELPRASSAPSEQTIDSVTLALDAAGQLYWDNAPIDQTVLVGRLQEAVAANPDLAVYLRADRDTRYEALARIMADARRAGVARLGFVSQPEAQ
ncbi:Biopolymer transport protein ExbD/TolR [Thioalkalivibrio nitratireducens DSM 14787]|uniref:Biopolymer transport protein ExbD/TolR n=1 Tax=Thioalkalivibrio nitratireducens (strain DSM 14787 / UNIQEM 213 / ALEN2) TaxID=1255043 RepID=L0DYM9_THIND|nr:biopolymer transporter ExbD [Thioalkalivibrio nitratireducens]AGA34112.1 Biopolymer transport protein ExbD/TolR [Thioalkalivibrio nitratireducens DSM 14787]